MSRTFTVFVFFLCLVVPFIAIGAPAPESPSDVAATASAATVVATAATNPIPPVPAPVVTIAPEAAPEPPEAAEAKTEEVAKEAFGVNQLILIGDATAQAFSDDSTSAFGGGIDYSTLRWNFGLLLRVGTDDGVLNGPKEVGRFMLTPENYGKPSLEVLVQWFPAWRTKQRFANPLPQWGFQLSMRGSDTAWALPGAEEGEEPETVRGNVSAFWLGFGARLIPIASNQNHVEVQGFTNFAFHAIGGDVALDGSNGTGQRAMKAILGTERRFYPGWNILSASLRIRSLRIGINTTLFPRDIPGFGGIQYSVFVKLHDGPVLTDTGKAAD